jgi:CRISPR-associated endonuclease Cas1
MIKNINALWIDRLVAFRTQPAAEASVRALLSYKDKRRFFLLRRYGQTVSLRSYEEYGTNTDYLLTEARNAKAYWRAFASLLPVWVTPFHRRPRNSDVVNKLLDIGYHHLAGVVAQKLLAHDIYPGLGLLHRAARTDGEPLVYDLMELFRADVVEKVTLTYLRQKKHPVTTVEGRCIGHFVHNVNEQLLKRYYLKAFKQCHTFDYCIELQIEKFMSAVNHKAVFEPMSVPVRHDGRCPQTKQKPPP